MTRKTLLAYTAPGHEYPQFVNVSKTETGDLSFMVRGHAEMHTHENGSYLDCGPVIEFVVPLDAISADLQSLAFEALSAKIDEPPLPLFDGKPGERRTAETVEAIGDISVTRRMTVESMYDDPLQVQVARLASVILELFENEPSQSQGAVDTAIRLIRAYARLQRDLDFASERLPRLKSRMSKGIAMIAEGLRAGLAEQPGAHDGEVYTGGGIVLTEMSGDDARALNDSGTDEAEEQQALEAAAPVAQAIALTEGNTSDVVAEPESGAAEFVPAGGRDPGDEDVRA